MVVSSLVKPSETIISWWLNGSTNGSASNPLGILLGNTDRQMIEVDHDLVDLEETVLSAGGRTNDSSYGTSGHPINCSDRTERTSGHHITSGNRLVGMYC